MLNKILITITALLLALLSGIPASAKIVGFSAPTNVLHPGDHFDVTFRTSDWIINVQDYYALFGIEQEPVANEGLGTLLGNGYDLVTHDHSITGAGTFKVPLQIPKNLEPPHKNTKYQLKTAFMSAVRENLGSSKGLSAHRCHILQAGLPNGVTVNDYTATITISP